MVVYGNNGEKDLLFVREHLLCRLCRLTRFSRLCLVTQEKVKPILGQKELFCIVGLSTKGYKH